MERQLSWSGRHGPVGGAVMELRLDLLAPDSLTVGIGNPPQHPPFGVHTDANRSIGQEPHYGGVGQVAAGAVPLIAGIIGEQVIGDAVVATSGARHSPMMTPKWAGAETSCFRQCEWR